MTAWAKEDPDAAIRWAKQTNDDALRQKMIAAAVIGQANNEPQAAARLAAGSLTDERAISDATTAIARLWAAKDAPAAARWISASPAGISRDQALEEFLPVWAGNDPAQATAWVQSITDPNLREHAQKVVLNLHKETGIVSPAR